LQPTKDNGGALVTNYLLFRNDGNYGLVNIPISSYSYAANGFEY